MATQVTCVWEWAEFKKADYAFGYGSNATRLDTQANTATLVACGWAGSVMEKVTEGFGQEQ